MREGPVESSVRMIELGEGPPVLLLHGTPIPAGYLLPLARALAERFRVLLPHLPGYGGTPALPAADVIAAGDRRVEDALLARGVEQVGVVGFSLGGYRALEIALHGRLEVTAVAALSGFAHLEAEDRAGKAQFAAAVRAGADLREAAVQLMLAPATAAARPDLADEARAFMSATSPANLAAELEGVASCVDLRPQLGSLDLPVLARVGTLDAACPPHLSRALASATGGSLEIVPGVTHGLLYEDLPGTSRSVLAFLQSVPARV